MKNFGATPANSLGEELNAGHTLLQLLKQEQEHLVNAELEGLAVVTEEKLKTVTRMTELAQQRHRTLAAVGFNADESGMQNWLKSAAPGPAVNKSWRDLLEVAKQAKELNRVNGLLIGQHMGRNQGALNVLRGSEPGGNLYGPNGQSTTQPGSRTLVVG